MNCQPVAFTDPSAIQDEYEEMIEPVPPLEREAADSAAMSPENGGVSNEPEQKSVPRPMQKRVDLCDSAPGWMTYTSAEWWGNRLRDHLGKDSYN